MTKKLVVTILWLAAGVGQSAFAAQLGPYVGGAYGVVESQADLQVFDSFTVNLLLPFIQFEPTSHVASLDTEGQGYTGMIGYRLTAHFAIEGMFADMGEVTYRSRSEGAFIDGPPAVMETRFKGSSSGIGLYALGILPLSYRWEIYGRAGLQFTTSGIDGRLNDGTFEAGLDFGRESSTHYVAGVGIAMSVFDIYGARLEYIRVFDVAEDSLVEGDLDMLSLGFIVAF